MNFNQLNIQEYILQALERQGIIEATEIQEKTIPAIMQGNDVVGKSQTGSGKTFAFGIPAIQSVDTKSRATQVLIVSPTRELASQVCDELRKITRAKEGCRVVPIFGGSNMDRQVKALKDGARIVVGTPGRLMDHLRRKTLRLQGLKMLVLDEADEMLDMGFREDIETILESANADHQTVMFSATMPAPILAITNQFMREPQFIEINHTDENLNIEQFYVKVGQKDKSRALSQLYKELNPNLSIIFCNTKRMVDVLVKSLNDDGINAVGLHGDMRQGERKRRMDEVKSGEATVLVATDVAARGIDIKNVDVVFNFDIPNQYEYYTHRIGRTARAGKTGRAYSIITGKAQLDMVKEIQRETKNEIQEYCLIYSKNYDPNFAKENKVEQGEGYTAKTPQFAEFSQFERVSEKSYAKNIKKIAPQPAKKLERQDSFESKLVKKPKRNYNQEKQNLDLDGLLADIKTTSKQDKLLVKLISDGKSTGKTQQGRPVEGSRKKEIDNSRARYNQQRHSSTKADSTVIEKSEKFSLNAKKANKNAFAKSKKKGTVRSNDSTQQVSLKETLTAIEFRKKQKFNGKSSKASNFNKKIAMAKTANRLKKEF